MTKTRRLGGWILSGCVAAALAVGLILLRKDAGRQRLADEVHYPNLPPAFSQALEKALQKMRSNENDRDAERLLARLYQANRLYPEARAVYQKIGAGTPGLGSRDHYYLALLDQDENDLVAAQKELREVVKNAPNYLPARLALAEVLFKTGREDEAEKAYSAVLAIDPNQPQAMLGLARLDLQRGNDDAAASRLEDLMAVHSDMTTAAALFAQILNRRGESDRAEAMTEWSRQKPEPILADPWMTEMLADCYDVQRLALLFESYFKTGQIDQAIPFLRRVEILDPKSPAPQILKGWSAAQQHDYATAVAQYQLAIAKGGDLEKICPYLIQAMITLGQVSEAEKLLADYYARTPESIPVLTAYADVAARRGDEKLAKLLLTKLVVKDPYLYSANVSLGKILWAEGDRDGAAKCLQRIASVEAGDVASRALLGEYFLGKSDPVSAIKPLEQAIALTDARAPLIKNLKAMLNEACLQSGNAEEKAGRVSAAVKYYDKGIAILPADSRAYAYEADACARLGQFGKASEALQKMSSLQPENPTIYLSLGDVNYRDGKKDEAVRNWQKALQLAGAGDGDLRRALADRLNGAVAGQTYK